MKLTIQCPCCRATLRLSVVGSKPRHKPKADVQGRWKRVSRKASEERFDELIGAFGTTVVADRLTLIRSTIREDGSISLLDVMREVNGGPNDVSNKHLQNLVRVFRSRVNTVALNCNINLQLRVDTRLRRRPEERAVWLVEI